jgi:hypothetical protein
LLQNLSVGSSQNLSSRSVTKSLSRSLTKSPIRSFTNLVADLSQNLSADLSQNLSAGLSQYLLNKITREAALVRLMESIIGLDHHGEEATAENLSKPGVVTVSKYFADGERGKVKDTEVNDEEDTPDAKTNPALPRGRRLSTGFINSTTIIFSCLIGHPHADERLKQILTKNQNFKTRLLNLSE